MSPPELRSLAAASARIVATADLDEKVELAFATAKAWFGRRLSLSAGALDGAMPDRPGRPERPILVSPRELPKRSVVSPTGRIAMIHSLAHIELNAVDLTWDLVGRFVRVPLPRSFFDNWVQVGLEEAKHYALLADRLKELGAAYGDLPAHDGLWQATQETGHDLTARLAILPLVLEARGLDVTPPLIDKMNEVGDAASANILSIIYRDEKRHVAFGAKWFRFMCDRHRLPPEPTFRQLVIKHFRGPLKPPFNDAARSEAGMTPGFYRPLAPRGVH
ncbi:ferritin-like domain-containing protein [Kaistia granuli]|uniref:ferritin-like domain-containing protein n=1 Tax=Kaistia granuli TaxID=363259 RepID=UPI000370E0DE|nr:ferritin-like domain-containing protein [Kaistia granuli]